MSGLFFTGTDTNVGKTFVAAAVPGTTSSAAPRSSAAAPVEMAPASAPPAPATVDTVDQEKHLRSILRGG